MNDSGKEWRGQMRIATIVTYRTGVNPGCEPTLSCWVFCVLGVRSLPNITIRCPCGNSDTTMHRAREVSAMLLRYFCGDSVLGSKSPWSLPRNGNRTYVIRFECQ